MDPQPRFDTWDRVLGAGALETQRDGMGREVGGDPGWGTHIHLWLIHVWQNHDNIVK